MSTIHIYIILKHAGEYIGTMYRLSTIHIYIILKLDLNSYPFEDGLSTIHIYIILKQISGLAANPLV